MIFVQQMTSYDFLEGNTNNIASFSKVPRSSFAFPIKFNFFYSLTISRVT